MLHVVLALLGNKATLSLTLSLPQTEGSRSLEFYKPSPQESWFKSTKNTQSLQTLMDCITCITCISAKLQKQQQYMFVLFLPNHICIIS